LFTADSWGQLACWPYSEAAPEPIWKLPEAHPGWIRAVAVHPDGQTVATGGNDTAVRLWSSKDGKLLCQLPHPHRVFSLCYHPDGKSLVSGDFKGVIRHWELAGCREVRRMSASILYADEAETKGRIQQCGGARHLQFDQQGKRLVCAGQKEPGGGFATGTPCVLVYDWHTGQQIREMPMGGTQDGFAYDARFHPEGFVMATSCAFPGKGHVWFWHPEDDAAFFSSKKLPNGRSLSLHPDGRRLALLTSQSRNGNGRSLKDGVYEGGSAEIRLVEFPAA
jgi:WD40 repeat protein